MNLNSALRSQAHPEKELLGFCFLRSKTLESLNREELNCPNANKAQQVTMAHTACRD